MRRALIANAEAVTGAKVEIAQLKVNLNQGKVFLQEVQVADPRNTDLNLFQADMAYLDIDFASLLRRKIKIIGGRSSDLRFGSPRTSSGSLTAHSTTEAPTTNAPPEPPLSPALTKSTELEANEPESRWLDQLQSQIISNEPAHLQSAEAVKTLAANWSPRLSDTRRQLAEINQQIEQLKKSFENRDSNPLRQDFEHTTSELSTLLQQTTKIQSELSNLHAQADSDKTKLAAMQRADQQAIEQLASIQSFDGDAITQLLLVRSQRARVNEIIRWFSWFRESIPDFDKDLQPQAIRGLNVAIPPKEGKNVQPDFLIEDLDIEGAGHFAGQFLNFAGKLNHLSNQPKLNSQATSFDLRAQGKHHFVVKCELDRRSDLPTDTLEVRCPDLQIEQGPLGSDRSILVTVGPNLKLQADVQLKAIGDSLAGEIIFRHSNVSLHVDQLNSLAGGTEMALRLNQELAAYDQFETRLSLSGTIDQYQMKVQSDLGDRFAQAMTDVSADIQRHHLAAQRQKMQATTQRQATDVTSQIDEALTTLDSDAQDIAQWLQQTRENVSSTANSVWPSIR